MIATPSAEPTEAGIELGQVCTTSDASVWLRHEVARHADEAKSESSPVQARALRGASSTLEVYAAVIGTYRDPAGFWCRACKARRRLPAPRS